MSKRKIKLILVSLIATVLTLAPVFAFAQVVPVAGSTPALPLYVANTGIPVVDSAVVKAIGLASAHNNACATTEQAYFTSKNAAQISSTGIIDTLTGSADLTRLTQAMGQIQGFITCRKGVLAELDIIVTQDSYTAQQKASLYSVVTAAINNLNTRLESTTGQQRVAAQSFWKTLLVKILIQTTQTVSTNLLNHLVSNYKINNLVNYAGSLASLVYDNQYIQANYSGSNADQMIIRSFIQNPAVDTLSPSIISKANLALGFAPSSLQASDPNFYVKLGMLGGVQANPYYQQVAMQSQANAIHNAALSAAQTQISQSNGFKAPMSCPGVVAQQQSIDQAYKAANDQVTNRAALTNQLLLAQGAGKNVSPTDLAKAQADLAAAQNQLDSLPKSFDSGAITICKDIVSPAALVNQGINEALHSIGQSLGNYNNNNLPFFVDFISGVASRIANNLIFGGSNAGASVISELKNDAIPAAGLAIGTVSAQLQTQQNNGLIATSQAILDDPSNSATIAVYSISWDASSVSNATGVIIAGSGLPAGMNNITQPNISGTARVILPASGSYSYTITVIGKSKADVLATTRITILPRSAQPTQVAATTSSSSSSSQPAASSSNNRRFSSACIDPNYQNYGACMAVYNDTSACDSVCGQAAANSCPSNAYPTIDMCLQDKTKSTSQCAVLCAAPKVAGASASRPTELIRGEYSISPR